MDKLKIYKIRDSYIDFLRKFDSENVKYNKKEKRPYIGILLQIEKLKYFAPLASPKPKHKRMKNNIDFVKIDNGDKGVINLNNMIPVVDEAIILYDILNEEDEKYKNLLLDQLKFINQNADKIVVKAKKLYHKVTNFDTHLNKRCVKFKLLEEKCILYTIVESAEKEAALAKKD